MLGYVAFLALIFLPGLAANLLLRQVQGNLVSILARSYGLSLVLNSLIGFADSYAGVYLPLLALVDLAVSLLIVILVVTLRYRSRVLSWLTEQDLRRQAPIIMLGSVSGVLLLLQFIKYPIFPKSFSVDFIQHAQLVQRAVPEVPSNPTWTILYGGVHLNLAMGLSLEGGAALLQLPLLMALLTAPSSLLFYEVALKVSGKRGQAMLTQVLYIATGFVWYVPLYDSGLYPNLYAIIVSLFYLLGLWEFHESNGMKSYAILLISTLGLYFSHYSVVLFVAAVDTYVLVRFVLRRESLRFAAAVVATSIAPAGIVLTSTSLLEFGSSILGYGATTGAFPFTTPLADSLGFSPFLHYLTAEIFGSTAVVLLFFTIPLALYTIWSKRNENPLLLLVGIWFGVIWLTSPQGDLAWRFSNEALTPLLILAPASLELLAFATARSLGAEKPKKGKSRGLRRRSRAPMTQTAVIAVLTLLVFSGSWTNIMILDLATNAQEYSAAQADLYNSMSWFNQNTPASSSLLSVTDWRISFMQQLTGRHGTLLGLADASQAVAYAKANNFGYILVTFLIPADVPAGFDAVSFYNSFSSSSSLREVYSNPTDVIYQLVS